MPTDRATARWSCPLTCLRPHQRRVSLRRALDLGGAACVRAVGRQIKLARAGELHDAVEDAWTAMQIYHGWTSHAAL
jgi:hypothetical protein